jgi:hypothetical protein
MAESKSGWGLDFYWPQLLERLQMAPPVIIDQVAITHTRPVGSAGNGCAAEHSPMQDLKNLQRKYQFPILAKQVVAAIAGEQLLTMEQHKFPLKLKLIEDALQIANLPPEARGLPVPSPWPNSWPSLKYAKNEKICANGAASCGVDLWFF